MRAYLRLTDAQQAHRALLELWADLKPWLLAQNRLEVTVRPETRTTEQNAKFHALCSDLAKSGVKWAGKTRNASEWKVLLVSGHAVATHEGSEIVPGLEGEFINLRESTALMSKKRGSSLIEYTVAFCAQQGVRTLEPAEAPL